MRTSRAPGEPRGMFTRELVDRAMRNLLDGAEKENKQLMRDNHTSPLHALAADPSWHIKGSFRSVDEPDQVENVERGAFATVFTNLDFRSPYFGQIADLATREGAPSVNMVNVRNGFLSLVGPDSVPDVQYDGYIFFMLLLFSYSEHGPDGLSWRSLDARWDDFVADSRKPASGTSDQLPLHIIAMQRSELPPGGGAQHAALVRLMATASGPGPLGLERRSRPMAGTWIAPPQWCPGGMTPLEMALLPRMGSRTSVRMHEGSPALVVASNLLALGADGESLRRRCNGNALVMAGLAMATDNVRANHRTVGERFRDEDISDPLAVFAKDEDDPADILEWISSLVTKDIGGMDNLLQEASELLVVDCSEIFERKDDSTVLYFCYRMWELRARVYEFAGVKCLDMGGNVFGSNTTLLELAARTENNEGRPGRVAVALFFGSLLSNQNRPMLSPMPQADNGFWDADLVGPARSSSSPILPDGEMQLARAAVFILETMAANTLVRSTALAVSSGHYMPILAQYNDNDGASRRLRSNDLVPDYDKLYTQ